MPVKHAPITSEVDATQRRASRDSFFLQAQVTVVGTGQRFAARVRNLSPGGMMADCDRPPEAGDQLEIELRGVEHVTGVVAWVRAGKFGVCFDRTINPAAARKPVSGASSSGERPVSHAAGLFNKKLVVR